MDKINLIQLEIDHLKLETERCEKRMAQLQADINYNISRMAYLISELAKLKSN